MQAQAKAGRVYSWRLPETLQRAIRRGHPRVRCEEGSSVIEMALSMVVLLMILFGLIDICLALYTYHFVSDAAREGSRFAIVRGSACALPGYECNATAPQIQTYVQGLAFPGIDPSNMTVTTTWSAYPAGEVCASAACNDPGDLVTVQVNYNFPVAIPFVSASTIAMSSTSSMVISH